MTAASYPGAAFSSQVYQTCKKTCRKTAKAILDTIALDDLLLLAKNSNTVEALVSGHPRGATKVSVTGDDRLRECENTEFVREFNKTGF